ELDGADNGADSDADAGELLLNGFHRLIEPLGAQFNPIIAQPFHQLRPLAQSQFFWKWGSHPEAHVARLGQSLAGGRRKRRTSHGCAAPSQEFPSTHTVRRSEEHTSELQS